MIRLSRHLAACVFTLWLATVSSMAVGHPLPNTLVTLEPRGGRLTIEIDTPADDLLIAMRAESPSLAAGSATPQAVGAYYLRHLALEDRSGTGAPLRFVSAKLVEATDPDVGGYREWRTRILAETASGGTGEYTLLFDAVIHQIPNHVAMVRVGGDGPGKAVGVVRHDFVSGVIRPIQVNIATGDAASGFVPMIAAGFAHVLSGLDHILFLAALLMAAPFEAVGGRWRYGGMNRRALGRFAAISGAFTLGHSTSLAAGAFGFDAIPARLTEILVALSIIVAAAHALRPLFPRREWLVAAVFGLVHGLAFSQTITALDLGLKAKIGALLGFNLGVELAQLTVMATALPLLVLSGLESARRPRQAFLGIIAAIGALWIVQRALGFPLPAWLTV